MRIDSLEVVLNSIHEPAAILEHDGRIHVVNERWSQVNTAQALAGGRFGVGGDYPKLCADVRGAPPAEELAREVRDVLAGRVKAFTLEYACERTPSPRQFEITTSALLTSDGIGALIVHRDITAQRELAAARRQAEERLQHMVELLPEAKGYWDWNLETDYVYYSDRWIESLGYSREEIMPNSKTWVDLIHPDDRPRVLDAIFGYIEGRYPVYSCELRIRMKSGQYRWILDRGRSIARDATGKALRLVGMEIDISERKETELVIQEQARRLTMLSTPLIPISDRILVMPLIGSVDAQRAEQVLSTLLEGLSKARASVAILDITGMSFIDAQVAAVFVHVARAVQLLGAQVVLTGVRPEVATTLVGLGVDLSNITMRGTLQAGITYAASVERARPAR